MGVEEPAAKRARVEERAAETQEALRHVAARLPPGQRTGPGAVLQKGGPRTVRFHGDSKEETFILGAACSEVFSGPRLAKVLAPAVALQAQALECLRRGEPCEPLSIHTSCGVPAALGGLVEAWTPHLPWAEPGDDWFMNLQLEGATAVWAGVEVLMRLQQQRDSKRTCVAVGERSYHGPKTNALGQLAERRWPGAPATEGQLSYPLPVAGSPDGGDFLTRFDTFLEENAARTGCILFEPQWGSTFAGRPWPKELLQEAVRRCRARGLLVLCDEIMCGLGRHGHGTLFLSKAYGLEPDCVTFGKSIAAGPFPMSGILVRQGAKVMCEAGSKVVQCHTYAGSSSLALLTAREVLLELPAWFEHARRMGEVVAEVLGPLGDGQFLTVQGTGLMWGGLFVGNDEVRTRNLGLLRQACKEEKVWPYFVPSGGFMMTPPMDIEEGELREGLTRLARALRCVRARQPAA